jgi:hypothetical protein
MSQESSYYWAVWCTLAFGCSGFESRPGCRVAGYPDCSFPLCFLILSSGTSDKYHQLDHCCPFKFYYPILNPSNPGVNYGLCTTALTINNSSFCIYVFRMILSINNDYFLKQHQPVDLWNGEVLCFLSGTDWILKYYFEELLLQRVNIRDLISVSFDTI